MSFFDLINNAVESNQSAVATAGGIPESIMAMSQHPDDAKVQERGCRFLIDVCAAVDDNGDIICSSGELDYNDIDVAVRWYGGRRKSSSSVC